MTSSATTANNRLMRLAVSRWSSVTSLTVRHSLVSEAQACFPALARLTAASAPLSYPPMTTKSSPGSDANLETRAMTARLRDRRVQPSVCSREKGTSANGCRERYLEEHSGFQHLGSRTSAPASCAGRVRHLHTGWITGCVSGRLWATILTWGIQIY